MQSKLCKRCKQSKPIRYFRTSNMTADGHISICASCFGKDLGGSRDMRVCLKCSEWFQSESKFNRLCNDCKEENAELGDVKKYLEGSEPRGQYYLPNDEGNR